MKYLFGDSTDSGLELDYLALLKDLIDCAVVLVENEATLANTIERRQAREKETAAVVAAVEALGKDTTALVHPIAKENGESPVGRTAAAIVTATKQAVDRETAQVRSVLAAEVAQLDKKDQQLRESCRGVVEKLLRVHDLPAADKVYDVVWANGFVKGSMRQQTKYGVEATIDLEVPAGTLLASDLRVDRLAEGIDISAVEAGGWLKKSDKLVPHKIGRYHIVRVTIGTDVVVRTRATAETGAPGFDIKIGRDGNITVERSGGEGGRELSVEERSRAQLKVLGEKLAAAVRELAGHRTALASVQIDGVSVADHAHPRTLAERLITAVAPIVQKIDRQSRSPGELVLRILVASGRREEVFVTKAELVKRYDKLPASGRAVFAPLQLDSDGSAAATPATSPPPITAPPPMAMAPIPVAYASQATPITVPARRSGPTSPPPPPPGRSKAVSVEGDITTSAARPKAPTSDPPPNPSASGKLQAVIVEATEPEGRPRPGTDVDFHPAHPRPGSIAAGRDELAGAIDAALGEADDDEPTVMSKVPVK